MHNRNNAESNRGIFWEEIVPTRVNVKLKVATNQPAQKGFAGCTIVEYVLVLRICVQGTFLRNGNQMTPDMKQRLGSVVLRNALKNIMRLGFVIPIMN